MEAGKKRTGLSTPTDPQPEKPARLGQQTLQTLGDPAESAEAIVSYLRARFSHILVIVPQLAMSAATMIACAADEIVLGKHNVSRPMPTVHPGNAILAPENSA